MQSTKRVLRFESPSFLSKLGHLGKFAVFLAADAKTANSCFVCKVKIFDILGW